MAAQSSLPAWKLSGLPLGIMLQQKIIGAWVCFWIAAARRLFGVRSHETALDRGDASPHIKGRLFRGPPLI